MMDQPSRGRVVRLARITRAMVRCDQQSVFVYGDNMEGRGLGGQAGQMRGEPNTIGVPTKWKPERTPTAYFTDADWNDSNVRHAIVGAFDRMLEALAVGKDVVIPADGLGTGLAELPQRSPLIFGYIVAAIASLEKTP
jgi:hypothetical protein